MTFCCLVLAVLSIWDYPARQPVHDRLRREFVAALRGGDTPTMEHTCRKGVELLPDDPTWHYNLACSLAYFKDRETEAFDELEKAIDLGFRDVEAIQNDADLKRLSKLRRYAELLEYADQMKTRPLLLGPMASVPATGLFGRPVALGEQNLGWDFDVGCFEAKLKLAPARSEPHTGDLYMNRDAGHSALKVAEFPGLTEVRLDGEGRRRGLDQNLPNILFPYPLFGNSSMAFANVPLWRSIPRALMTTDCARLPLMQKLYLSNQFWVFPSNADTAPVGTNGDVFASIAPYWLTTAGRSWSDLPYLRAALQASAALKPDVKREIVRRGLLVPTLMTLIRKSLGAVRSEEDYLTLRGHPTAFPPGGLDTNRLVKAAAALTLEAVPPLASLAVRPVEPAKAPAFPECTYRTAFAVAYVLRSEEPVRVFEISARAPGELSFSVTHDALGAAKLERLGTDSARLTLDRRKMSVTNRVDVMVSARTKASGWGAPSYASFAVVDPTAAYSDPVLTPEPVELGK